MLPAPQTTPPTRAQRRDLIRERRETAYRWRHEENLSYRQICERFARRSPPLIVHISQISRDLDYMDRRARKAFERRQFDPVGIVLRQEQRLESLFTKAVRDAHRTKSVIERVAAYRVAALVLQQIATLWQDCGVIDSRIAQMIRAMRDDGVKVEATPNGIELQEWFNSIRVTDDALVSTAERAQLYGDSELVERIRRNGERR